MWGVRFPASQREAIDAWAKAHALTRAEAIRRLVQCALNAPKKPDETQD